MSSNFWLWPDILRSHPNIKEKAYAKPVLLSKTMAPLKGVIALFQEMIVYCQCVFSLKEVHPNVPAEALLSKAFRMKFPREWS